MGPMSVVICMYEVVDFLDLNVLFMRHSVNIQLFMISGSNACSARNYMVLSPGCRCSISVIRGAATCSLLNAMVIRGTDSDLATSYHLNMSIRVNPCKPSHDNPRITGDTLGFFSALFKVMFSGSHLQARARLLLSRPAL